ncbi:MAG TPA: hypothetical protein PKC43_06545 [Phycisphaerales bacterium]|nr:hypothetical protein [Phycisphaerales bacterium]HMP37091.1 hypothetical protein [Phycisphaerales bacterium]
MIPHPTPGCAVPDCCVQVCIVAPDCCDTAWSEFCVELASQFCAGLCGAAASLDCFSPNGSPACSDTECCTLICGIDPFCCDQAWDTACAVAASFLCAQSAGTCGDPATGSCFESHSNGACADPACCQAVCSIDPTCCSSAWDFLCVLVAFQQCGPCTVACPPGGDFENEACPLRSNDPCVFPTPGAAADMLSCGQTRCGIIVDSGPNPDVDVYRFTVVDLDGDGLGRVRIELNSSFFSFAAIIPPTCAPLASALAFAESVSCTSGFIDTCLPAGDWYVAITSGNFPVPTGQGTDCFSNGFYTVKLTCLDGCSPPCSEFSEGCFEPHASPGCNEVACCDAVCDLDPLCCLSAWDVLCVLLANDLCDGGLPANDDCSTCVAVGEGEFFFTTIGATTSGPPLPAACDEGAGLSLEADVWFCYTPSCSAPVTVETCGASFDTRIAVYHGTCSGLALTACNDDSFLCLPVDTSRLTFQGNCGTAYFIRVGGFGAAIGTGTLRITCGFGDPCSVPCPGDLDGNGIVDGADLGILLGAWNTAGPVADLDGSGLVDGADLGVLLGFWGTCPGA